MEKEIFGIVFGKDTLTITNIILSMCIVFHLICEFSHYILEFIGGRKKSRLLNDLLSRVSKLEEVIESNSNKCPFKKKE